MDARELREAAEIVAMSGTWGTKAWHAAKLLADHALAAVRPDDGERLTEAVEVERIIDEVSLEFVRINAFANALFLTVGNKPNDCECVRVFADPTKGQFRRLCEALGIETKEERT